MRMQELTLAAGMLDRVLSLNVAVCQPYYEAILAELLAPAHPQPPR